MPPATLRRFWTMLAHYHGQTWSAAELARSFGVAATTVGRYLDLLTSLYLVRQLPPWYESLGKRQVRASKVYLADSGMLHTLLGIASFHDLKFTDQPKVTKSMLIALEDLRLDRIDVVHAGRHSFPLGERIGAVSIERLADDLPSL